MGARISSGFTIIETMLFLAVTGLLIMGALIGTGTALSNQRYRDSVETFKNLVQTQYAELNSIKNDRTNAWTCGATAKPVAGDEYRGQSDCLIVGRYMIIDEGDISIFNVLARENAVTTTTSPDITVLRNNYTYNVADGVENRTMEWGTKIAWPSSGTGSRTPTSPRTMGILFMRSPDSGRVYTFSSDTVPVEPAAINNATFTSMMFAGNAIPGQGQRTVCVESSGGILGGDRAVYMGASASTASAVEVRSNQTITSLGGDTQC